MPLKEGNNLVDVRDDPIADVLGWTPRLGDAAGARRFREASEVVRSLWKVLGLPGDCMAYGDLVCPSSVCVISNAGELPKENVVRVVHLDNPTTKGEYGPTKWWRDDNDWADAPGGDRAFCLTCRAAEASGGSLGDDVAVLYAQLVARWAFRFVVEEKPAKMPGAV